MELAIVHIGVGDSVEKIVVQWYNRRVLLFKKEVLVSEFLRELQRAWKNTFGDNNPDLKIYIYTKSGILMHRTRKNFKKVCDANGLPFFALRESYLNNSYVGKLQRIENRKFEGWYARIMTSETTNGDTMD